MKRTIFALILALSFQASASDVTFKCSTPKGESFTVLPFKGVITGKYVFTSQENLTYDYDGIGNTGYMLLLTPDHQHPQFSEWNESYVDGPQITFTDLSFTKAAFNNSMAGLPIGTFDVTCVDSTIKAVR